MAVFVLVHGAWHGGWCWAQTAAALREHGHEVHTPTLTGVGERSHLLSADIVPDTHVADIVQTLKWRSLEEVILVGHSYGGMVITGVAGQCPERLRALVYLDAFVPERSGEALFATANPERMAGFQAQMDAGAVGLEPDAALMTWAEDPDLRAWIAARCTPHPVGCFTHGVTLTDRAQEVRHRHYMVAAKNVEAPFQAEYARIKETEGWTHEALPTWHDAMVEEPLLLADRLEAYAAGLSEEQGA